MLGAYFVRKRRKKGLSSKAHFVFLVLSLRLKRWLRFVLRIIDYPRTNKSRNYNTPHSPFKASKFHSEINLKSSAKQRLSTSLLKALILH
nr:MAG TPA: hypothetical protein [Caudoviricetes sp.]